jgi:hypothetical protein
MVLNETMETLNGLFDETDFDDYQLLLQIKSLLEAKGDNEVLEKVNLLVESMESKQQHDCLTFLEKMFENLIYIRNFPENTHEHNWFEILHLSERDIAYLMIISPKIINRAYIESIWDFCLDMANNTARINGVKTALNFTWEEIFETDIGI